jgi:hypothetical protein
MSRPVHLEDLWATWGPPENPNAMLDPETVLRLNPALARAIEAFASPFASLDGDGETAAPPATSPTPRPPASSSRPAA